MLSAEMIGSPESGEDLAAELLVRPLHPHDERHGELRLARRRDDAVRRSCRSA